MNAGNHPDIDIVALPEDKRWLSVDLFLGDRDHRHQEGLCYKIGLRPRMGRRRVAIIDDADGLTIESANCLLKTLEEPPPGAVLILIGTNQSRQLPTILSRTQVVRFDPLPLGIVSQLLIEQGFVTNEQDAQQIATEANGSLQRAHETQSMNLGEFRQRFLKQFAGQTLDATRLVAITNEFVSEAGTESEAKRQRLRAAIALAIEYLRVQLLRPEKPISTNRAINSRLLAALDRCVKAEEELDRNANQATLLECWVNDLASLPFQ